MGGGGEPQNFDLKLTLTFWYVSSTKTKMYFTSLEIFVNLLILNRIFRKFLLSYTFNFKQKKNSCLNYYEQIHVYWHLIPNKLIYLLVPLVLFNYRLQMSHLFLYRLPMMIMMKLHVKHRIVQTNLIQSNSSIDCMACSIEFCETTIINICPSFIITYGCIFSLIPTIKIWNTTYNRKSS